MLKIILKKYIKKNSKLYLILSDMLHIRKRYWMPKRVMKCEDELERLVVKKNNLSFIQVGSNDGESNDPLRKHIISRNWNGILIEPVPYLNKKLLELYRDNKGIKVLQIAVDEEIQENKNFYYIKDTQEKLPPWSKQIGSFSLELFNIYKDKIPDIDKYIEEMEIKVESLNSIIQTYKLDHVELIHVDAEGYDYNILKSLDFKKYSPLVVLFEHIHLKNNQYKSIIKLLKSNGYKLRRDLMNTIAILHEDK